MVKAVEICRESLWISGVTGQGSDPSAEELSIALSQLNDMIAEWGARRWLIYRLVDTAFTATSAINYTVGPGGNFNLAQRPDRIEAAYVRLLTATTPSLRTDYELTQILAREDYSKITLKQMQSFPDYYFYDPAYPQGFVYIYPIPTAQYEIHIITREILSQVAANDTLLLPIHYPGIIKYNLARRIRTAFRYRPDPEINAIARNGLNVISSNNFAVPVLELPAQLRGGVRYNFFSDTVN